MTDNEKLCLLEELQNNIGQCVREWLDKNFNGEYVDEKNLGDVLTILTKAHINCLLSTKLHILYGCYDPDQEDDKSFFKKATDMVREQTKKCVDVVDIKIEDIH